MSDPFLSVIMATARASRGSLLDCPDVHLLEPTLNSLARQRRAADIEIVIADCCVKTGRVLGQEILSFEAARGGEYPFRWKVVPVASGFWLDRGMWSLQHAFNEGFVAADGRHVMFSGDACEFPEGVLDLAFIEIEAGRQPHLLVTYKRGGHVLTVNCETKGIRQPHGNGATAGKTLEELKEMGIFGASAVVRDSRWPHVEQADGRRVEKIPWSWCYNHITCSREDVFSVNGWDENFDGSKALGDCAFGSQLELAGRWRAVLDARLYAYEHTHGGVDQRVLFNGRLGPVRSNYLLMGMLRERGIYRGNAYVLSAEDHARLRMRAASSREDRIPIYPEDSIERRFQDEWAANHPIFDIRERWAQRRAAGGKATA